MHAKTVHRIVALAAFGYYGISTNGLCVCHLDEERHNPCIDNLALGTSKENSNFEKAKQRYSEAKKGYHHSVESRMKMSEAKRNMSLENRKKMSDAQQKKRVGAYKDGVLTLIFNCVRLTKVYGFNASAVCNCCKCRHYFARNLLKLGLPLPAIQKMLGHSSVTTTQHYTRLLERENAEFIANALNTAYRKAE